MPSGLTRGHAFPDHTTNQDIRWSLRFNLPELHSKRCGAVALWRRRDCSCFATFREARTESVHTIPAQTAESLHSTGPSLEHAERMHIGLENRFLLLALIAVLFAQPHHCA